MLRSTVHLILHVVVPLLVALAVYRPVWRKSWIIMLVTMAVDLDHLLADPIYDPDRCSIGFHPLHSYPAVAVYIALLAPRKTRLVATGLTIHMMLDAVDCAWM